MSRLAHAISLLSLDLPRELFTSFDSSSSVDVVRVDVGRSSSNLSGIYKYMYK